MRRKKKKFNPAKAKRKLDRLFSQFILARDERVCQWCGASRAAEGAHIDNSHIIPREFLSLRWHPDNSLALCFGCHKRRGRSWHGSPLQAIWWLREKLGDDFCERLLARIDAPFEFNAETAAALEINLKAQLSALSTSGAGAGAASGDSGASEAS